MVSGSAASRRTGKLPQNYSLPTSSIMLMNIMNTLIIYYVLDACGNLFVQFGIGNAWVLDGEPPAGS